MINSAHLGRACVCGLILGNLGPLAASEPPQVLPPGEIARLGSLQLRHANQVFRIAFHPNGKLIVTNGHGFLSFWEANTGRLIDRKELGPEKSYTMGFTPDGLLVTAAPFAVWDAANRSVVRHFKFGGPKDPVIVLSPDGKMVAAFPRDADSRTDNVVALWDVRTGERLEHRFNHLTRIACAAFAPDGTVLATADDDGTLTLWNVKSGQTVARYKELLGTNAETMAFSPDGRKIATVGALTADGADKSVRLWDAKTGRPAGTFGPTDRMVHSVAYSPNGKLLASGQFGSVRLWDVDSGRELRRWEIGGGDVNDVAFSPDGKTLAATSYGTRVVRLFDVVSGKERFPLGGHAGPVHGVAFSPDGRTLFSSAGEIVEWDIVTAVERRRFVPAPGRWGELALSPDGRRTAFTALGARRRELYLGELPREANRRMLPNDLFLGGDVSGVRELAFSPGPGRWLAMARSRSETIGLWDLSTGKQLASLTSPDGSAPEHLALSADGKFLATTGGDKVEEKAVVWMWDTPTGKQIRSLPVDGDRPWLAFSPTAATVLIVNPNGYTLWDADSGRTRSRAGPERPVWSAVFSPDGQLVAIGAEDEIQIWETMSWREVRRFTVAPAGGVRSLAFAPNMRLLASGLGRGEVVLWDVTGRRNAKARLDDARLARCWELLADDGAKAYTAVWELADDPQRAVPFLRQRLREAAAAAEPRYARLLRELDDPSYAVRQRATKQLGEFRPALAAALKGNITAEARRRIEACLKDESKSAPVRLYRAIQVLEYAATPEAKVALRESAGVWDGCCLPAAAKAALVRLER